MLKKPEYGVKDLQTQFPEVANEWDYEKNGGLTPSMVTYGSAFNAWWKCSKGHGWQATVNRRTFQKSGCPYCGNRKVLIGFNDLQTKCPEVAKEWNYEKNGELKPNQVLVGSHKKVWWICSDGHEWEAPVDRRVGLTKSKCPYCSGHYMTKGKNDLLTSHPEIAAEWDYEKNGDLKPDMVAMSSHTVVWWKCINGHEWEAPVDRRTGKNKSGCPYCCRHFLLKGMNDLQTVYPDIAVEWNVEKNGDLKPDMVAVSANRKVWWKGNCGHEWQATVNSRTGKNKNGCPICTNRELLTGYNDLQTVYPEIAEEWNYEKNGDLKPDMIVYGSNKRVWWKCEKGHEWKTSLNHRVSRHDGCPQCKKEMKSSFPEQCIYYYICKVFPDAENGNRSILKGQELDIYVPSQFLAIEFDGGAFHANSQKDTNKFLLCEEKGIRLIRVRDSACEGLPGFDDHVILMNSYSDEDITVMLRSLCVKLGVTVNIDVERDRAEIYAQYIFLEKENSVAQKRPDIAMEWSDKNGNLQPSMIHVRSNRKVWWKCSKGHEWQAVVYSRTGNDKCGCPYCSNQKLLSGYNDLLTIYPEIAKEWNYEKNCDLTPDMVLGGSHRKVWWKCQKDHEWLASIDGRTGRKLGCPICANKIVWKGFNDLQTVRPEIAEEWNDEKNGEIKPDTVVFGSNKKVWWKCAFGHEWQAMISARTRKRGTGCPYCAGKRQ